MIFPYHISRNKTWLELQSFLHADLFPKYWENLVAKRKCKKFFIYSWKTIHYSYIYDFVFWNLFSKPILLELFLYFLKTHFALDLYLLKMKDSYQWLAHINLLFHNVWPFFNIIK